MKVNARKKQVLCDEDAKSSQSAAAAWEALTRRLGQGEGREEAQAQQERLAQGRSVG